MTRSLFLLPLFLIALAVPAQATDQAPVLPAQYCHEVAQGVGVLIETLELEYEGLSAADKETLEDIQSVLEEPWAQELNDTWKAAVAEAEAKNRKVEYIVFTFDKIEFHNTPEAQGTGVLKLNHYLQQWMSRKRDRSFGQRYPALQEAMQNESRRFAVIAKAIKA